MRYEKKRMLVLFLITLVVASVSLANAPLTTVQVDLERYQGTWYEIARLPLFWERTLVNVTATYSLREDGKITVLNAGKVLSPSGLNSSVKGLAWVPDSSETGKLKVQFFSAFSSDYWVLDLDQQGYSWAIVGQPDRTFLWILSRTPQMDEELYAHLVQKVEQMGFNLEKLEKVLQQYD